MVHTRSTYLGRNTPPPEIGEPSNNEHVAALEIQIAQMSMDIEVLTEQNLRLLGQIPEESNMNEGGYESDRTK
jgi:hypothetical protein